MEQQSFLNEFEEKEKMGTLKTLTVLTFIGCGLFIIGAIIGCFMAETSYEKAQELVSSGKVDQLPAFLQSSYTPEKMEMMQKNITYKWPILIINLISFGLCLFGAINMRKRKVDGYWMWLIGELLPFAGAFFFLGAGYFSGIFMMISLAIIGIFIILYSLQKKLLS